MQNLRQFLRVLEKAGEIVHVQHEVDPHLEIAEIHRRVAACNGPALFFHRVKGSAFPVVTNLFGSDRRVALAFASRPEELVARAVDLLTKHFPPTLATLWKERSLLKQLGRIGTKRRAAVPLLECVQPKVNLEAIPFLTSWPEDGGPFLTLPLVYTEPPGGGPSNLGMYRIQRYDQETTGLHFQIAKGGGFHYHRAESENRSLPVSIFLGGSPALLLSAITPLPENVPELLIASLLQGEKLLLGKTPDFPYPLLGECEFAFLGEAKPHVRRTEGPFGDHYGYYSLAHDFPVFNCKKVLHRKGAIYPATIVGKPRQEDFYIGNFLQKLLSPLFPVVMPAVKALWSYGETGFHSLGAAIVKERYARECMTSAFRILGEGQLALTKFLLLTDQRVELSDIKAVLPTILERFQPETDLFVFAQLSLDTLDYTGPALNHGSRGVLVGVGEKRRTLPEEYRGALPSPLRAARPFCPGCLVIEAPAYGSFQEFSKLLDDPHLAAWPLLILVDDLEKTLRNDAAFLWTTFTRFEPAADLHAHSQVYRHHLCYRLPILIDARMKPSYPKEVLCDEETEERVTRSWELYFPKGMEGGSSRAAHVY